MAYCANLRNGNGPVCGQRLLPHVLRDAARSEPEKPWALAFERSGVTEGFRIITVGQMSEAVNATAWWMKSKFGQSEVFETVAYIGVSDMRYEIVHLASIVCGYKLLCISVRNSESGYLSLLDTTGCTKFICSSEFAAKGRHIKEISSSLQLFILPSFQEMLCGNVSEYPYNKKFAEAEDDPVLICHTSGSTGAPKPITLTNGNWVVVDNMPKIPKTPGRKNQDWSLFSYENRDCFLSSFPPFHATGMIAGMLPLLYNSVIVVPPPEQPVTGESCLEMMQHLNQQGLRLRGLLVAPTILEQLVQEPGGLQQASKLDFVMFTGGPLAPSVGSRLSRITDICQLIGSTETGPIPGLVPARENWSYFEWQPFYKIEMELWADDTFELIIKQDPDLRWIRTISHTMPHTTVWHSSDLYRQHPQNPKLWRFHGRTDDVIVLSNGEKFNPVTMEAIIQGDPLLTGALYSGQARFQPALLVEPKAEVDEASTSPFLDQVWPSIEKANIEAPKHAQIFRHKIAVATPSKPFRRAAKGTVVRKSTLQDYSTEIEALYSATDAVVAWDEVNIEETQDLEAIKKYVQKSLHGRLEQNPSSDSEDLFSLGLDSLQTLELATTLNAGLSSRLMASTPAIITAKRIYTYPSINSLSEYLYRVLNPSSCPVNGDENRNIGREARMANLVNKYTQGLPPEFEHAPREIQSLTTEAMNGGRAKKGLSVIVTGTTGSLGTYLFLSLLNDPIVGRIYCLNRGRDSKDRQARTFATIEAGQDANDSRLTYLQVDLSQERFGLDLGAFSKLIEDVDAIIHNAWKVDFNHTIESFESQIAGVRNFIDFAQRAPRRPYIIFVSSVSSVGNWAAVHGTEVAIPESPLEDYTVAQKQGYGESKYVSERILQLAAESCSVPVSILRVGQIGGPLKGGGCWNKTEWLPSLVLTSKELGLIPNHLPDVDWVPIDSVARIAVDILHAGAPDWLDVFNLVNPHPVKWSSLVPVIQEWYKSRQIRAVPLHDWIDALHSIDVNDADEVRAKPAVKILDFFEGIRKSGDVQPMYDTQRGVTCSKEMAHLAPVSAAWMRT